MLANTKKTLHYHYCNLLVMLVLWEAIICCGRRRGISSDHLLIFQLHSVNFLTYKDSWKKTHIFGFTHHKKKYLHSFSWFVFILLVNLYFSTFQQPHASVSSVCFNHSLTIILKWLILLFWSCLVKSKSWTMFLQEFPQPPHC